MHQRRSVGRKNIECCLVFNRVVVQCAVIITFGDLCESRHSFSLAFAFLPSCVFVSPAERQKKIALSYSRHVSFFFFI